MGSAADTQELLQQTRVPKHRRGDQSAALDRLADKHHPGRVLHKGHDFYFPVRPHGNTGKGTDMRACDYIVKKLVNNGIKHVFMLTGGGAMFLDDAIGLEKRLHYVCNQHEQACAMAAEG